MDWGVARNSQHEHPVTSASLGSRHRRSCQCLVVTGLPARLGKDSLRTVVGEWEWQHIGVVDRERGITMRQPDNSEDGADWRRQAEKIADLAVKADRPVVFLLGAGCSLKSGGPTDRRLQEEIEALPGRQRAGEALGRHVDPAAQALALRPLFEDMSPNVGYYCLVGLARKCSVYVLNLNFDTTVSDAANNVGVKCYSDDVRNALEIDRALDECDDHRQIVNIHLHGTVENARFTREQKANTKDVERDVVHKALNGAILVVLGASLRNAEDVGALLKDAKPNTAHYFNRADEMSDENDKQIRSAEFPLVGANVHWTAPDMDFDAFMLHFAGAFHEHSYDEFSRADGRSHLGLPTLDNTALPHEVLRQAMRTVFENRLAVISGPPHVGKSIAGNIVSYCLALSAAGTREDAASLCFSGAAEANEALAVGSDAARVSSVLLLKPVAADDGDDFFSELLSRGGDRGNPPIVVCCGDADLPAEPLPKELRQVLIACDEWYSHDTLESIGRRKNFGRRVVDGVREHSLANPGTFLLGLDPYPTADGEHRFVAHYLALLSRDRNVALDCCLLRMAELTNTDVPLRKVANGVPEDDARRRLLVFSTFEGSRYAVLANESVRHAVDEYLRIDASSVVNELRQRAEPWSTAQEIWSRWALIQEGRPEEEREPEPCKNSSVEFFPLVLSSRPELGMLTAQIASAGDAWAIGELCYEIVKNWGALRSREARQTVATLIADKDKWGLYGMLEAVLYFGRAADSELTSLVQDWLWERVRESDIGLETWLSADALYWRSPMDGLSWTVDWLRTLENADAEGYEALRLFEAAFHPDGYQAIERELGVQANPSGVPDAKARMLAELVQWHFVHQSNARARFGSVTRRPEEKAYLCRTLYPRGLDDPQPVLKLVEVLSRVPDTAGWGFHAGCRSLRSDADDGLDSAIRNALGRAMPRAPGVVTAVMGYELTDRFRPELSQYFGADGNQEFLLDCLGEGVLVKGVRLCEPRFEVSREPGRVLTACGVDFRQLRERGIHFRQWPKFEDSVNRVAQVLNDQGLVNIEELRTLLPPVLRGDLRALDATLPARALDGGEEEPLAHAIQMACLARREQPRLPFG